MQRHSCPCRKGDSPACEAGACYDAAPASIGLALLFIASASLVVGILALFWRGGSTLIGGGS